jgi:hypothetical protein
MPPKDTTYSWRSRTPGIAFGIRLRTSGEGPTIGPATSGSALAIAARSKGRLNPAAEPMVQIAGGMLVCPTLVASGLEQATSIFGGQVNAIIVLPILLGYAVGYLILVIATIRVVGKSIARRRRVEVNAPQAARPRWLDAASVTLLACSIAITGAVVFVLGSASYPVDEVPDSEMVGNWVSATTDAPGELQLAEAGKATSRNLTVLDQSAHWDTGVVRKAAEQLDANGTWLLRADNLHVTIRNGDQEIQWTLLVTESAFGGLRLEAIVGDPDGPAFTQVFEKAAG